MKIKISEVRISAPEVSEMGRLGLGAAIRMVTGPSKVTMEFYTDQAPEVAEQLRKIMEQGFGYLQPTEPVKNFSVTVGGSGGGSASRGHDATASMKLSEVKEALEATSKIGDEMSKASEVHLGASSIPTLLGEDLDRAAKAAFKKHIRERAGISDYDLDRLSKHYTVDLYGNVAHKNRAERPPKNKKADKPTSELAETW